MSYKDGTNGKEIIEENNYYPFGLKHKGYNNVVTGRDHKYGFGGKEEQDELGLDWIDITARNYDPALGRWMNLDPLAEMMRRHSPYNYAFDNPIFFTDPDGMYPLSYALMKSSASEYYDFTGEGRGRRGKPKSGGDTKRKTTDYQAKFEQIGEDLANMDTSLDGGEGNCCPGKSGNSPTGLGLLFRFSEYVGLSDMASNGGGGVNFSLASMYGHFRFGGGTPMTIKMSSIDFSGTSQKKLGLTGMMKGDVRSVSLFEAGTLHPAALAFGRVRMTYHGNNQFSIVSDKSARFDFSPLYDPDASMGRNVGNTIGASINYNLWLGPIATLMPLIWSGPYPVYFNGTTTISQ